MGNVLCFGEALIDMLALPPDGDAPRTFAQHAGGAPANVAVAVARLGGDARFVGMLGEDMFGAFLLDSLREAGVATDGIVRTATAKTALAFVALDPWGERSFSFYRPPAADLLFRESHFRDEDFVAAAAFHACSNSMTEPEVAEATLAGMRRAGTSGAVVSFDLNLRPMLWAVDAQPLPWLWRALALADVVKLSREELGYLVDASQADEATVIERLWQGRTRLLVVTDGGQPTAWRTREAAGSISSYRVDPVDATGAGDAFVAGMLCRLVARLEDGDGLDGLCRDRDTIESILRFASAVGALAVTRKGAFAAMPRLAEVQALMQEQP
jgi:fructokinase